VVAVGNPPVDSVAPDSVAIDWNNILNHNAIQPSIIMPGMVWPTALMTAAYADDNSTYYPIVRFNGDMVLPSSGRGMLIITGSLTINGNTGWKGVIMVGDDIVSNGNNGIEGATVSGLNTKIGTYHPGDIDPSTANGTKQYNYNSCEVAKATTTMGALVTLRNTWVDNWVEY
jgi:hypothetical protein